MRARVARACRLCRARSARRFRAAIAGGWGAAGAMRLRGWRWYGARASREAFLFPCKAPRAGCGRLGAAGKRGHAGSHRARSTHLEHTALFVVPPHGAACGRLQSPCSCRAEGGGREPAAECPAILTRETFATGPVSAASPCVGNKRCRALWGAADAPAGPGSCCSRCRQPGSES